MLTKAELEIVDALATGRSMTPEELVDNTGRSWGHIRQLLDGLLERNIVHETRDADNRRHARLANTDIADTYRRLIGDLGHVEWDDLLTPALLRVYWHLDEPRRIAEVADRLGVSRQYVHATLNPIKDRGMLARDGPMYALTDDLEPLLSFSRAVVQHVQRERAWDVAPSAMVGWHDPEHVLVRPTVAEDTNALDESEDWHVTGLAAFREYGLQFFLADEPAFWYAPEASGPTVEQIACHTLVLNSDPRRTSYTMLLLEAADVDADALSMAADTYGVSAAISSMQAALDGEFDADGPVILPSKQEFESLKTQYDLD